MALIPKIKRWVENLPPSAGKALASIPYGMRPVTSGVYRARTTEIAAVDSMDVEQKRAFVFERVRAVAAFAAQNVDFYTDLYRAEGFEVESLREFDDLDQIPIVTKDMLREYELERRSAPASGRYLENTGGSSGSPLAFYVTPSSVGHEWAHLHAIWNKLGYRQSSIKLTFSGRNVGRTPVQYDALRHNFFVNIYEPNARVAEALTEVLTTTKIEFIQGYPSAIYDFACYCQSDAPELQAALANTVRGTMLNSEYPAPVYRDKIESVFSADSVSWYGHTERAVLAWEKSDKFVYNPFLSYGFAESIASGDDGTSKLVATSYYNMASPFVRYDCGDEISPVTLTDGILEQFRVEAGREGDYIVDKGGKRIALTGLIFGRHHKVFNQARFLQIAQDEAGKATLYVTGDERTCQPSELPSQFDLSNTDIDFEFRQIDSPILTSGGKAILNISKLVAGGE